MEYTTLFITQTADFTQRRLNSYFMHDPRNALTVDLTEWIDHTNEEYFTVTLRFLSDFADAYQPQFLLSGASDKQIQRVLVHGLIDRIV